MNKKSQYEIQDVSLWPNILSLDQKKDQEQLRIKTLIQNTKKDFFEKNQQNLIIKNIIHLLDPTRDIYYHPKANEPSLCKAGLHYSIPDEVVGIGLAISPEYENQQQWAILYHGTKPNYIQSILKNGLRPGGGQAHRGAVDPWDRQYLMEYIFLFGSIKPFNIHMLIIPSFQKFLQKMFLLLRDTKAMRQAIIINFHAYQFHLKRAGHNIIYDDCSIIKS